MSIKIYYDILSQPARSVLMFARSNKIHFTPCPIALRKLEHRSEAYSAIVPLKKVPALQDEDFIITEGVTITKYLHEKFGCPDHWYPRSLQRRSKVNEYLDWHHSNTRPAVAKIFHSDILFPRIGMLKAPVEPEDLEPEIRRMDKTLDLFLSYFLQNKPFICGDEVTIADIFAVNEFIHLGATRYTFIDDRPTLKAWIERVRQQLTPELYDDVNSVFTKLFLKDKL